MAIGGTKVVQVTNIAPQATKDQMQTLFGYLGKIEDIRLYPTVRDVSCPVQSRICYIKFIESNTVGIAQHMTNTVFIDRALIVIPIQSGDIPDEYYALEMTRNGTIVPGLCPSEPKLPANVVNSISGTGMDQVIITSDPQLDSNDLPPYPPLPVNYDSVKIEEVRRTILLGNVDMSSTIVELAEFFQVAGEIKYVRACVRETDNSEYFMIEFSDQPSVLGAMKLDGTEFKGKPVTILHSTQAIVKPQAKSNEAAQKEIEEAMSRVKEAQSMISAAIDPVIGMLSKDKRSSRRSRSRSRGRRRRSRSRSRPRRSRSRGNRRKSRSRERSRDRRRRSRSRRRSKSHTRRSTSRKRSRSKSHSKSTSRRHRSKDRSRDKSKEKERKSRDKSRERSSRRDVEKKERSSGGGGGGERERERDRDRDRDRDRRVVEREPPVDVPERKRSRSPSRSVYRSRSRDKNNRGSREKKRSRSKERSKRVRSASRERKRTRSRSKDRKKDKKERKNKETRSRSRSKLRRNYDEEEKGFDSEKERSGHDSEAVDKESSEKSDNMDISNSP